MKALLLLCFCLSAHAAGFVVDTTADTLDVSPGDGICVDSSGMCSLRAAVQEANASQGSDEIVLGDALYALAIAGALEDAAASGDLDITSDIAIVGVGAQATLIDGGALDRVFDVHVGATLRLSSVTVRNGAQSLFGGNDDSEHAGGGVLIRAGAAVFLDGVDVRDNASQRNGAGIALFGRLHAVRLRVLHDIAGPSFSAGGGLYLGATATSLDLDQCEFSANAATQGGGVFSDADNPPIQITRCLIAENSANDGAAIYANLGASHWLLRNDTISGNVASSAGGALFADSAHQLRFEHCTITQNQALGSNGGGAIFDVRGSASPSFIPVELVNTILSGNSQVVGNECSTVFADVIVSGGGTLHATGNACRMVAGPGDVLAAAAGLQALLDNGGFARTHALALASVAIDAAQTATCAATDQRGLPRPFDGNGDNQALCDIGAYEYSPDSIFADGFE